MAADMAQVFAVPAEAEHRTQEILSALRRCVAGSSHSSAPFCFLRLAERCGAAAVPRPSGERGTFEAELSSQPCSGFLAPTYRGKGQRPRRPRRQPVRRFGTPGSSSRARFRACRHPQMPASGSLGSVPVLQLNPGFSSEGTSVTVGSAREQGWVCIPRARY